MLEKQSKILMECNNHRLTSQCENEDLDKEILLYAKDKSEEEIEQRRKMQKKRLEYRKNLYIYPEQANV